MMGENLTSGFGVLSVWMKMDLLCGESSWLIAVAIRGARDGLCRTPDSTRAGVRASCMQRAGCMVAVRRAAILSVAEGRVCARLRRAARGRAFAAIFYSVDLTFVLGTEV